MGWYPPFVMRDPAKPAKRRTYEVAFRAEARRLAAQSRSTQAAARALNTDPQRPYQWQKTAQTPAAAALGAAVGAALNLATALELRPLRPARSGPAQEPGILTLPAGTGPMRRGRCLAAGRAHYRPWLTPPCGGPARYWPCRPAAVRPGRLRSSGRGGPEHAGLGNGVDLDLWPPQTLRRAPSVDRCPGPGWAASARVRPWACPPPVPAIRSRPPFSNNYFKLLP